MLPPVSLLSTVLLEPITNPNSRADVPVFFPILEMALPDFFLNQLIKYHYPVRSVISSDIYPGVNDMA